VALDPRVNWLGAKDPEPDLTAFLAGGIETPDAPKR
jgi:hypothetical protein